MIAYFITGCVPFDYGGRCQSNQYHNPFHHNALPNNSQKLRDREVGLRMLVVGNVAQLDGERMREMIWQLFKKTKNWTPDTSITDRFDYATDRDGTLHLRCKLDCLDSADLSPALDALLGAAACFSQIEFDFASTTRFDGPWGSHFAMLIRFHEQCRIPVHVSGLRSQPGGVAWIYRRSSRLRQLLTPPAARTAA
jgi:hypothetical protein